MSLRKAAEMALERLESHEYWMDEEAIQALRQALAQPEERGHCTCGDPTLLGYVHFRTRPCIYYTAPPKREWVGLTKDEIEEIADWSDKNAAPWYLEYARAIEAKLKEKNSV